MHIQPRIVERAFHYCMAVLASMLWINTGWAQAVSAADTQLKAALVYNFAKFVEWPATSLATPSAVLHLCVTGRGPVASLLAELAGKSVQGHELRVQSVGATLDPKACHLLFVAAGAEMPVPDIVKKLKGVAVFTVSDASGFVEAGGMVEIVQGEGRLQFDVNLGAAQQANLRLSAHLLKLARIRKGDSK